MVPRDRITTTLQVIMRGPDARQIQVEINRRMVAALAKSWSYVQHASGKTIPAGPAFAPAWTLAYRVAAA